MQCEYRPYCADYSIEYICDNMSNYCTFKHTFQKLNLGPGIKIVPNLVERLDENMQPLKDGNAGREK